MVNYLLAALLPSPVGSGAHLPFANCPGQSRNGPVGMGWRAGMGLLGWDSSCTILSCCLYQNQNQGLSQRAQSIGSGGKYEVPKAARWPWGQSGKEPDLNHPLSILLRDTSAGPGKVPSWPWQCHHGIFIPGSSLER